LKNNKDTDNNNLNLLLSKIPSVEIILQNKALKPLIQKHSRKMLTQKMPLKMAACIQRKKG